MPQCGPVILLGGMPEFFVEKTMPKYWDGFGVAGFEAEREHRVAPPEKRAAADTTADTTPTTWAHRSIMVLVAVAVVCGLAMVAVAY